MSLCLQICSKEVCPMQVTMNYINILIHFFKVFVYSSLFKGRVYWSVFFQPNFIHHSFVTSKASFFIGVCVFDWQRMCPEKIASKTFEDNFSLHF